MMMAVLWWWFPAGKDPTMMLENGGGPGRSSEGMYHHHHSQKRRILPIGGGGGIRGGGGGGGDPPYDCAPPPPPPNESRVVVAVMVVVVVVVVVVHHSHHHHHHMPCVDMESIYLYRYISYTHTHNTVNVVSCFRSIERSIDRTHMAHGRSHFNFRVSNRRTDHRPETHVVPKPCVKVRSSYGTPTTVLVVYSRYIFIYIVDGYTSYI